MEFIGYTEHAMCSTPPNLAVKWYFEWVLKLAEKWKTTRLKAEMTRLKEYRDDEV